jgi:hypothetical protein
MLSPTSQASTGTSGSTGNGTTNTSASADNGASGAPSSVGGNTAQDALLALFNNLGSGSNNTGTGTSGNTAQDALMALLNSAFSSSLGASGGLVENGQSSDPLLSLAAGSVSGSVFGYSGTTAQSALLALLQASPNSAAGTNGSSATGTTSVDFAAALSVYQYQANQQMLGAMFGTGSTSV